MFNFFKTEGIFITGVIMLVALIGAISYWPEQQEAIHATSTVAQLPVASSTSLSQTTVPVQTSKSVYASSTQSTATAAANQTVQTISAPTSALPPLTTKPSIRGGGSENEDD